MTNKEAIKYLQQLYPNGGHCWLDEQRMEAVGMAIRALQEEPVSEKKCMFTKDSYTDEDRKVLCEDCEERCEYSKKEEPVSEFLNTESMIESYKQRLISKANGMKKSPFIDMCLVSYKHGINETLDTLNLSNVQRIGKNWKEPVSEKDKLRALSDGKQHLGWLDDANALEEPINKELDRFIKEHGPMATLEKCAAHFAEWGKKHSNLSVSEDLEEAAIEYCGGNKGSDARVRTGFIMGANWQKANDESITEDLEEAAWLYYDKNRLPIPPEWDLHKEFIDFFKAGANWQKTKDSTCVSNDLEEAAKEWLIPQLDKSYGAYGERKMMELTKFDGYAMLDAIEFGMKKMKEQMIKNAIEREVKLDSGGYPYVDCHIEMYDYLDFKPLAKAGDKVKLIVIKED